MLTEEEMLEIAEKYMETGVYKFHVPSGPFLVEKETGRIVNFGTARSLNFILKPMKMGL